jgi:Fe2+ or Zn2+ uptake regulation protein
LPRSPLAAFYFQAIEALHRDEPERFAFSLTGHAHELFGTCKDCQAAVPR